MLLSIRSIPAPGEYDHPTRQGPALGLRRDPARHPAAARRPGLVSVAGVRGRRGEAPGRTLPAPGRTDRSHAGRRPRTAGQPQSAGPGTLLPGAPGTPSGRGHRTASCACHRVLARGRTPVRCGVCPGRGPHTTACQPHLRHRRGRLVAERGHRRGRFGAVPDALRPARRRDRPAPADQARPAGQAAGRPVGRRPAHDPLSR